MKPLLRDMVRVGGSVAAVTGLVLLPAYLLRTTCSCPLKASPGPAPLPENQNIVSLDEGWNSMGMAINDRGEVVGTAMDSKGNLRAFVVRGKKAELLPLPKGAPMSVATDINESGLVVGNAGGQEKVRGVLWRGEQSGVLTSGKRDTIATTVSKDGTAAGLAADPRSEQNYNRLLSVTGTDNWWGFVNSPYLNKALLQSANGYSLFDTVLRNTWEIMGDNGFSGMTWKRPGEGKAIGEFIPQAGNAEGSLVGIAIQKDEPVPAFFKAGKIGVLPKPEGAEIAVPLAVNGNEIAVGAAAGGGKLRPVGWSKGKTGFLPVPDGRQGIALGINNNKTVVGIIEGEDGTPHAAMWKDGKVTDLYNVIEKESGWTLVQARDINNNDQIVGTAVKGERFATFVLGCPKR